MLVNENNHESFLSKRIWLSISLILAIYSLIIIFGNFYMGRIFGTVILTNHPYLYTINRFVLSALFLLIFVPFLFRLPKRDIGFFEYLKSLRLTNLCPVLLVIGLGLLSGFLIVFFIYLSSLLAVKIGGGELFLNFGVLWDSFDYGSNLYTKINSGIWEEVVFRGIILVLLLKKYSKKRSIIISSVLFGLFHLINLVNYFFTSDSFREILINTLFQVVYATAIGFFFAYSVLQLDSLVTPILTHYIVNAFGPFVQVFINANLVIVRATQTILGLGIIPAILCIAIVFFTTKLWEKIFGKKDLKENSVQLIDSS
jgi:membrane protease YdiL (CAAX protease family)